MQPRIYQCWLLTNGGGTPFVRLYPFFKGLQVGRKNDLSTAMSKRTLRCEKVRTTSFCTEPAEVLSNFRQDVCSTDDFMIFKIVFLNKMSSNPLREGSLFTGWGTAYYGNPYNSRESPYLRLIFTQHNIFVCPP